MGTKTLEVNNAIRVAGNGAESYKTAGGNVHDAVRFIGGVNSQSGYNGDMVVYYNTQWVPSEKENASYILKIVQTNSPTPALIHADVTVNRMDGDELYRLTIAARRNE
jgi:hypothetical protein